MSDIFVSYAHEDTLTASRLVERLREQRWTVFWDERLAVGDEWNAVIEAEVRKACCVVVLFSPDAVLSYWVHEEASIALERGVLLPVLLELSEPPKEFGSLQASDLSGWTGEPDARGLHDLVHAITARCGGHQSLMVRPSALSIVTGRPKTWPALGAAVNVDCEFTNHTGHPAAIHWMEMQAVWPTGRSLVMPWSVPYDGTGSAEHVRRIEVEPIIEVPSAGLLRGVQFQAPPITRSVPWPAGRYAFEMLGWSVHERKEPANLRTRFAVSVDQHAAVQIKQLQDADDKAWRALGGSNHAIGVSVDVGQVLTGLLPS